MAILRAVPETPLKAVLYLRQSTFREESISLLLQETAGRDYCERMGYTVVAIEQDPGVSGRTWKRPAVQRVMQMVESRDADVIVLWRWSRLSRSRKDWALAADRVDVAGGRIESATEPNDVSAAGRFARGVMTELAAFESERIGEQWREVHANRVARGLQSGRMPWGWTTEGGKAVPHPDNASAIPRLYELYLSGMGGRQLAEWLGSHGYKTFYDKAKWNNATVCAILDSPFHAGLISYRGELHPGSQEPLVSVETWKRYRAMRAERANERAPRHTYLLSGLITCSKCGAKVFGFAIRAKHGKTAGASDYFGYRCKSVGVDKDHGPGTISARLVDAAFLKWLDRQSELAAPEPFELPIGSDAIDAKRIAREIAALDAQVVELTRQLGQRIVPERAYQATVAEIEISRSKLTESLQKLETAAILTPSDFTASALEVSQAWSLSSMQTKRASIRGLVASMSIDYDGRKFTISRRGGAPVAIDL